MRMTTNQQTPLLDHLFQDVRATFFSQLPDEIDETIWASADPGDLYAGLQIINFIGQAIDEHLFCTDTDMLLSFCQEDIHYFSSVPASPLCIRDHLSADHIVYHLIYDTLAAYLEVEWSEYVEAKRGEC